MSTDISLYQIVMLVVGLVGVYLKMNNEVNAVRAKVELISTRVANNEAQSSEIKKTLEQLVEDIHEIKLLLARKNLD
jgi:uncharacterized protein YoxC